MKMLKVTGNNTCQRLYMRGDKHRETEPEEFYLHFPGGTLGITRCSNGDYWAHINVFDDKIDFSKREMKAMVSDARIDCHSIPVTEMNIGDLIQPDCYHIAVKLVLTRPPGQKEGGL